MATEDDGVRWLLVRSGTRRIDRDAARRGRVRWTGDYWQGASAYCWGAYETAAVFAPWERDLVPDSWVARFGGEWVRVFVNVDPAGAGA